MRGILNSILFLDFVMWMWSQKASATNPAWSAEALSLHFADGDPHPRFVLHDQALITRDIPDVVDVFPMWSEVGSSELQALTWALWGIVPVIIPWFCVIGLKERTRHCLICGICKSPYRSNPVPSHPVKFFSWHEFTHHPPQLWNQPDGIDQPSPAFLHG